MPGVVKEAATPGEGGGAAGSGSAQIFHRVMTTLRSTAETK